MIIPTLKKGGTIGVFTPSYPITAESPAAAESAVKFVESKGYKIKKGTLWGRNDFYRSGTAEERADEFNTLLHDNEVDCLMASIGGFVSNGMLPYIDFEYFAAHPKPVVGMSDTTSLLMGLYARTGVTVYYGTNLVTSYARLAPYPDIAFDCLCNVLGGKKNYTYPLPEFYSDEVVDWDKPLTEERMIPNQSVTINVGKVVGRLIGGNLNTMTSIWGTPYMPEIKQGDILFLENTEEAACYTERYITWLKLNGVFDKIGALIIGKHRGFYDMETNKKPYEILTETIGAVDFPILAEFDCGHCAPMLTLPIGVPAALDTEAGTLALLY